MSQPEQATNSADEAGRAETALRQIALEALMLRNFLRGLDAYEGDRDTLSSGLSYAARAAGLIGWLADLRLVAAGATGDRLEEWVLPELATLGGAVPGGTQA